MLFLKGIRTIELGSWRVESCTSGNHYQNLNKVLGSPLAAFEMLDDFFTVMAKVMPRLSTPWSKRPPRMSDHPGHINIK